jgi:translocation and assembly module TamB
MFRRVAFQSIGGRADYDPQSLSFDIRLVQPDMSWISAKGSMPSAVLTNAGARTTAPLDVTVQSSPINLSVVQTLTTTISDVTGTMQAEAVISGTVSDPQIDGLIAVRNGGFSVPRLGTRYTSIDTTILLQPGSLVVDGLELTDDDHDLLTVSGRLPVGNTRTDNLRLDVRMQSFEVVDNAYADLEVDAALIVTGDLSRPIVKGTIEVIGGRINADEVLTLGPSPDLYSTTASVDGRQPGLEAAAPQRDGLLASLPLELDVRVTAPALVIAGRDLKGAGGTSVGLGNVNVTASGDLTLVKPADRAPRIAGLVETVRGTYEFQGREFELRRGGTIRFTGSETIDPILDVTAERTIAAVRTDVTIGGTLRAPRLELSSQPPLDRADILSLIVFNRPANELGAGERVSLSRRATAFATGYLAGEISEALGEAVGLDLFEIEAGSDTGDGLAPVVTVGEQLGELYLRFQQQVGDGGGSGVVIEYGITDWLRLETSVIQRRETTRSLQRTESSGVDAVMTFEYGGPDDEDTEADVDEPAVDRRPVLYKLFRPRR